VSEEDVAIGRKSGVPVVLTEALALHAQALAQSRDASGVRAVAISADSLLPTLAPATREYFAADLRATRAIADPLHNPREVDAALSKVIPEMSRAGVPIRLISAYLARAKARTELAWTDLARADVREAYRLIEQGRESKPDGVSRSLGRDARATLMGVVGTLVAQHREAEGLELLEFSQSPTAADSIAAHAGRIPPGTVAIRYARLGDSLVAWTASAEGVAFTALPVSAAKVDATLDSALTLLAERRGEPRLLLHLAGLYDDLIRPLEPRLGDGDTMVVIADGKLADVPFAALRHALAGRFLVQEHLLRQATSLAKAADRAATPASAGTARVGVVLDPTIDGTLYPWLPPLASARGESASVAGWWSRRRDGSVAWQRSGPLVLAGADAREDDVRELLERVSLLHFAGHAITDPEDPDSSQLVLAPGPGHRQLGRLTAAQIARMRLFGLDLVVLSACSTLGGDRSGAGGFAGLGGAFLGAGARGVIGSLWEVDDALTGELMARFYEEYAGTSDAAVALRNAQLRMLRDTNPRFSPPWAWAGFEYAGG
jgi:CHAT domain-containing protein